MSGKFSRRNFLKLGSAAALASAIGAPGRSSAIQLGKKTLPAETLVKSYCPFCQIRCTYKAHVRNGKLVSLSGEKGNYWTGGGICPKGLSIVELVESPWRITRPMLKNANGKWEDISYDDAVSLTAEKMLEVKKKHGKDAGNRVAMTMPNWDCYQSEIAALMALRTVGSVHAMPPGETCVSTASNMLGLMLGIYNGTTKVDEILKTDTLVLWGANVSELYPVFSRWLAAARDRGVRIIYIDPRKTRTSIWADTQLRPRPGTDGALALGAIRHILATGAFDEGRARFHIDDFDNLRPQTDNWTIGKVADATSLSQREILDFYDLLCGSQKTIVWLGGALSRLTNGTFTVRSIILSQALRDNLIGEGKGMLTFQSGKPGGDEEFVGHYFGEIQTPKMNFRRLRMAMEKKKLDILFLNSSYRRNPDATGVRKAISNVPFVVHMGFFPDEESEVSTLFIPATFGPESQGTGYGNDNQIVWREKVLNAPGSCVPSWQFYRDVGYKVDPEHYPWFEDPAELHKMLQKIVPSWKGLDLDRLRNMEGGLIWPMTSSDDPLPSGTVFTDGHLLTPSGKMNVVDRVFGGIGQWTYPKGHPDGKEGKKEFPLILTQGKQLWHWHQTLTNFARSTAQFSNGRFIRIHPATAQALSLAQGDRVSLETIAGALDGWIDISDSVLPGTVFTPANCCRTTPLKENNSPSICNILPNYWDKISAQHNGIGCRLRKL